MDARGNLYVGVAERAITRVAPDDTVTEMLDLPSGGWVRALTAAPNGALYTVFEKVVYRIAPTGGRAQPVAWPGPALSGPAGSALRPRPKASRAPGS
jgi:streptogramin lyase